MERDVVLAKLFKVNEALRTQIKYKEKNSSQKEIRINHTSKEILRSLLNNNNINQRNLAGLLDVSPQAISESIKKLESLDLVIKVNGNQKNENLISLTEVGEQRAIKLNDKINKHSNEVLKYFTDEELTQFYNLLEKIKLDEEN